MLFTTKYAPKKLEDLLGNSDKVEQVKQWMLQWLNGKVRKPLIIYGPPGTGKTGIAYLLKDQFDLDLIEMNASELRNKQRVERVVGAASLAGSLFGRMKIILFDDADVLAGRKDSGGATAIKNFLADSPCPIIVTATNVWDKSFTPIRSECELVEFKRINKLTVRKRLTEVSKLEGLELPDDRLDAIAERAEGDMRAALNDLQSLGPTARVHDKDIFQLIRGIFKATKYSEVRELISGEIDYELIKLWLDENIPAEYENPLEVALAYDYLSKADVFDGRIKKQNWHFLKYSIDLAIPGVALAKNVAYRKFTKYNFPSYLRNMSRSIERRAMLKAIGLKIGKVVHANRRDALEYLPLIKSLGKMYATELAALYDFSEEELAFLLETSVSKVSSDKVKEKTEKALLV